MARANYHEYENQLFTLLTGNSSSAHLDVVDAR